MLNAIQAPKTHTQTCPKCAILFMQNKSKMDQLIQNIK